MDSQPTSPVETTVPAVNKQDSTPTTPTEVEESASIIVKNVLVVPEDSTTTSKHITDFFSFCGNIISLAMIPDESDPTTTSAILTFETPSAARTALLLHQTILNERAISVELAPISVSAPKSESETFPRMDSPPQTQTPVIKNLLNRGYQLSQDALQKAKDYDEAHGVTSSMNEYAKSFETQVNALDTQYGVSDRLQEVKAKVNSIDQEYGISESINNVITSTSESIKAVDEQYHISDSVNDSLAAAQAQAAAFDEQYKISETVTNTAEAVAAEGVRLAEQIDLEKTKEEVGNQIQQASDSISEYLATSPTAQTISTGLADFGNMVSAGIYSAFGWSQEVQEPQTEVTPTPAADEKETAAPVSVPEPEPTAVKPTTVEPTDD